ncbi:30S ribosomal protein S27ae [Candidatus Woesearchaeota archaeon]|jgi:ubiquitin-small subunit ribosomal protein S27Ae|nr:30S ribosomal protein S27ae [Candidatus Woesearchaeota archaeon]MBT3537570.1 30S ribosomal protein S27ae [Candidatus Woesearchaeota archaeon]MBT4697420.1 30S ribosomal protein S27ae [Candidatus Woesearchaeota archaeon]MBT7105239.1 30S ribosomal protein S27ae [Candidatus Woesearchaeota archaeon]MBT7930502.1 30S ribosomal protein S27ae [Candidatus Woesearchaeota archaeon]
MAKKEAKGKKEKKTKLTSKKWQHYKVSGDKAERDHKFCPKCGVGVFLGQHKNRVTCGKCNYTEFVTKKTE